MKDAKLLFAWHNDPEALKQSRNMRPVTYKKHVKWLKDALSNSNRKLRIAMIDGNPVGHVRIDRTYELSWTVAPNARKKGVGKMMVKEIADGIDAPIWAEIKSGNKGSRRIATKYAVMKLKRKKPGLLRYVGHEH
jgi:RimJ/RimL family protein N-acetyltransferase